MKNKAFKEYINELYNEEKNYQSILSKYEEVEKMQKVNQTRRLNKVAIFICIIVVGIISSQVYAKISWNIEFKEYQNRNYEIGTGIIKDDGYTEEVNMEYIEQDGIKAKVNSLFITDDEFKANIDFQFDDTIKVASENFTYGFAVYDEDNNIYVINTRVPANKDFGKEVKKKTRYILEDIGVKYNKNDIFGDPFANQWGVIRVEATGRNILTEINAHSVSGFPRSKKVFIRIFDLGYDMFDNDNMESESFWISDSEWIFEIDVPEKFYERLTTNLQLKKDIPGVEISKITVTEHGLQITAIIEGINDIILQGKDMTSEKWEEMQSNLIYITDEDGNRYNNIGFGTYNQNGIDSIHMNFEVTKKIFENSVLYMNYTDPNGKLYTVELIKE